MTESPAHADVELTLVYRLLGSVLRPLSRTLRTMPPDGVLALITDDP